MTDLARLLTELVHRLPGSTAEDALDAAWLFGVGRRPAGVETRAGEGQAPKPVDPGSDAGPAPRDDLDGPGPAPDDERDAPEPSPAPPEAERTPVGLPAGSLPAGGLPAPPVLKGARRYLRALRALRSRTPGRARRLDERATVERFAATEVWEPALAPIPEPARDLLLVVDRGGAWPLLADGLHRLEADLLRLGAFRETRRVFLDHASGTAILRAGRARTASRVSPRALRDPQGRTLVLVQTDTTGSAWWTGSAARLLADLGADTTTLLHSLPRRHWSYTALGRAPEEDALAAVEAPDHTPATRPSVAVVEIEHRALAAWALAPASPKLRRVALPTHGDPPGAQAPGTEESVARFLRTRTQPATRLAIHLAMLPSPVLTPELVRLVAEATVPDATLLHQAEFFLGGLVEVAPNALRDRFDAGRGVFTFRDGTAHALRDRATRRELFDVVDAVSGWLEAHWQEARTFRAALYGQVAGVDVPTADEAFAQIARELVEDFGLPARPAPIEPNEAADEPAAEDEVGWWSPLVPLFDDLPPELIDAIEDELLDGGAEPPRRGPRRVPAMLRRASANESHLLNTLGWWLPDHREVILSLMADRGVAIEAEMDPLDAVFLTIEDEGGPWAPLLAGIDAHGWRTAQLVATAGGRLPPLVSENRLRRARRWVLCGSAHTVAEYAPSWGTFGSLAWLHTGDQPGRPLAFLLAVREAGLNQSPPTFAASNVDDLLWWLGAPLLDELSAVRPLTVHLATTHPKGPSPDVLDRLRDALAAPWLRLTEDAPRTTADHVLPFDDGASDVPDIARLNTLTTLLPRMLPLAYAGREAPHPKAVEVMALAGEPRTLRLPDELPRLARLLVERATEVAPGTTLHRAPAVRDLSEIEFVRIPAGTFLMGSPAGEGPDWERPQHEVRITHDLLVSRTPVTQAQWRGVLDAAREASLDVGDLDRRKSHFEGALRPMESVSWRDVRAWCDLLSALERRTRLYEAKTLDLHADGYRLPTEAEWEHFARAGTTTPWSFGGDQRALDGHGWHDGNSGRETHPVATKAANPWGLHDVHGNVWEWCEDARSGGEPYPSDRARVVTDDPLVTRGVLRVLRGGSFIGAAVWCRSAFRVNGSPDGRSRVQGFRVVRPVAPRDG